MSNKHHSGWWNGARGEWYVVSQVVLITIVFFGPQTWSVMPLWNAFYLFVGSVVGAILLSIGLFLLVAGIFKLKENVTPLPYPKEKAVLIKTGPYRVVRHPMYCGGILIAFGWAFWVHGWLTIVYAVLLTIFFDIKSRREERWLHEKFIGYAEYKMRVHKLIPFIY